MTRSFFSGKQSGLSGYKSRLSGVSLAALAAFGIARPASAQEADLATIPDGYVGLAGLDGVTSYTERADGSVELVLESGETVVLDPADVTIIGDNVYAAEAALDAAGVGADGGGFSIGTDAIVAGTAVLVGGGVAISSLGESNDAPAFANPTGTASVAENQTAAFTATATDGDGDTVTYSLSGTDANLFSINPATGVITFRNAPDFEAPADAGGDNVYSVTVTATDGDDSVTQTVNITVTSVNEAPEIAAIAPVTVDENGTAIATAVGTDVDGDSLTYALSGADATLLSIDAQTGEITFVDAPDFETPADADGDNVYDVVVTVSDGELTASSDLSISVTDVNEAPELTTDESASAPENQTAAFTATGTDIDGDALSFSLSGADAALFTIDAATGVVSFIDAPNFEAPSDSDADNAYEVTVTASDGTLTDAQDVTITVTDVNEAPVFASAATVNVDEGQTAVQFVMADDADMDMLSFSLSGADAALFAIDAATGEVSFRTAPDFETPADADGDNIYDLVVTATDGEFSVDQDLQVTVADTDTITLVELANVPRIVRLSTQTEAVNVTLGGADDIVATGSGGDTIDTGAGDDVILSGAGADNVSASTGDDIVVVIGRTEVNEYTADALTDPAGSGLDLSEVVDLGALNGNATDNAEAGETLSGGAGNDILVVYGETDLSDVALSGFETLILNSDVTLTATQLLAFTANGGVQGDGSSILRVVADDGATDIDLDTVTGVAFVEIGADVTLTLSAADLTALQAADLDAIGGSGTLAIDATADLSGLTLAGGVSVVDAATGVTLDAAALGGTVTADDIDPVILQTGATAEIAENATGTVFIATAIGADDGQLSYSLSGADAALFTLDPATGAVSFVAPQDFETPGDADGDNVYDVTLTATDGTDSTSADVAVSVTDVNEGPVLSVAPAVELGENGTAVLTASATDVDGDALSYSLSGTDAALFEIDALTGALSFVAAPDFEAPADADGDNVYDISITVSDGELSDTQAISVAVTNVNEAPVIIAPISADIPEIDNITIRAGATDPEGDFFSLDLRGPDGALFEIDPLTNSLFFFDSPDFEMPQSANGTNTYEVEIVASEPNGLTTTQTIFINVTDQNDAPVLTSEGAFTASENQSAAFTATATDQDADALSYSLSGPDAALFTIDPATGVVSFVDAPDFEAPGDADGDNVYEVDVSATDGELSDTQAVTVTVTDENDAPMATTEAAVSVEENQSAAFTATAEDADGDTLSYSLSGADAGLFAIDAQTGEVTFVDAPDFEAPADADGDNVYDVTLNIADGTVVTSQDVSVTVTDVDDTAPDAPTILSVGLVNLFVPDASGGGGVFQFRPAVTGVSEPGATVEVFDGAQSLGTTTAAADGSFLLTAPVSAISGTSISAVATDAAGNVSDATVLDALFGFDPADYFAENPVEPVLIDELGASSGFSVLDSSGDFVFTITSSAGDINGDGFADILLGSRSSDLNGDNSGTVAVLYGGPDGFGDVVDGRAVVDLATLQAEDGFLITGEAEFDFLQSVSNVGDFNGDGLDDFIVGASGFDFESNGVDGAAYLVFGTETGLGEIDEAGRQVLDLATLTPEQGVQFVGGNNTSRLATSVSDAGDVNGDGLADLLISDPALNTGLGNLVTGGTYVVFGTEDALPLTDIEGQSVVDLTTLTADQGFLVSNAENTLFLGFGLAALGDVNGDGVDDFALADGFALSDDFAFGNGVSFIIYGSTDGFTLEPTDGTPILPLFTLGADQGLRIIGTGEPLNDGYSISSAGDFNGDGFTDIVIGAPDLSGSGNGRAYVVFGSADGFGEDDGEGGRLLDVSTLMADEGLVLIGDFGSSAGSGVSSFGDINGDGIDDLGISGFGMPDLGAPGFAAVIFGGTDVGSVNDSGQRVIELGDLSVEDGYSFVLSDSLLDFAGNLAGLGDIDGDGVNDFVISSGGLDDAAAAFVIYGGQELGTGESESLALVEENTTAAFVATSLGEGTVFELSGDDADLFTIDQATGLVSFIDAPDAESVLDAATFARRLGDLDDAEDLENFGLDLEITATLGDVTAEQEVAITVLDVNEFAPEFTTPTDIASANGSFLVQAEDADLGPLVAVGTREGSFGDRTVFDDALDFAIIGGADEDLFTIVASDEATGRVGLITFTDSIVDGAPADADGDGVYDVEISVTDGELTTTQTLSLSLVEGGAEPIFTSATTLMVDEFDLAASFQLMAEDPEGGQLIYLLEQNISPDFRFFTLDPLTGELTIDAPLSFTNPQDEDGDNVYDLTILVIDGENVLLQSIEVAVADLEFAPEVVSDTAFTFQENNIPGDSAFIGVNDLDADSITATITGGADAALFALETFAGFNGGEFTGFGLQPVISFDFETPEDADGDNVYEIEVTFSDGQFDIVETFTFTVEDVFESPNAPVFTTPTVINADEGERFVVTVNADDADNETPTYSIVGGEDASAFGLNSTTGELMFFFPPNFRNPADTDSDNVYIVDIQADDGSSNQTVQSFEITVNDVDVLPTLSVDNSINVIEGNDVSLFASAFENFDDQLLEIVIRGVDADLFEIDFTDVGFNSTNIVFSFAIDTDFEMPADADGDNVYEIELVVLQDGVEAVSELVEISISDLFETENAPVFTSADTVTVVEGPDTLSFFVVATDEDNETPVYSITGGQDSFRFNIDSVTGELSFNRNTPFTEFGDNLYEVEVTADDLSTNRTTQLITVEVTDTNVAPNINLPFSRNVAENSFNDFFVSANDVFDNDAVTLTLGIGDAALFELNVFGGGGVGRLNFITPPDFETPLDADGDNVYEVELIASDGVNETVVTLPITVTDVFESPNAPVFTTADTVQVDEGQSDIFTIAAEDADGEALTYSIVGGADQFRFNIDSSSGEISTFGGLRLDGSNDGDAVYEIEIEAFDGSGNRTTQMLTIDVQDVDVAPELFFSRNVFVNENAFNFFEIIEAREEFDDQEITISISGADSAFFTFSTFPDTSFAIADLQQLAPFDFENPQDENGDNVYEITVTATDGVNVVSELLTVTVQDVFESENAPVFTNSDNFVLNEAETFIVQLDATDADGETPTLQIVGGDDPFRFFIDQITQELSFSGPPRFNGPDDFDDNIYTVQVQADDGSGNQTLQTITVEVVDIDVAPIFTNIDTEITIDEGGQVFGSIFVDGFNEGQPLTLSLAGEDAEAFILVSGSGTIDFATASLRFRVSPDFELPTDANGDNIYTVDVLASDGVNTTVETVTVTVQDNAELGNAPVIISSDSFTLDEGERVVGLIEATDADGDSVDISINRFDLDASQFTLGGIDNNQLEFRFDSRVDTGPSEVFYVEVRAEDSNGNRTSQIVEVTVNNVNILPTLQVGTEAITTDGNFTTGLFINGEDFTDFDTLSLSLSGADAALFEIMGLSEGEGFASGDLVFRMAPNVDMPLDADGDNFYEVTVGLSDGTDVVTQDVTIEVARPSANAPVFVTDANLSVDEDETRVADFVATDADGDAVTFTVSGGRDQFSFFFQGDTLTLNNPSFLPGLVYEIEVTASDGLNATTEIFSVFVEDVNEAPNLLVLDGRVVEGSTLTGAFFSADDIDFLDTLTVSLSGSDADLFTIDVTNDLGNIVEGQIIFTVAPDFELPADADGDNVYEVTVEVNDGDIVISQDITITVEEDLANGTIKTAPPQLDDMALPIVEFDLSDYADEASQFEGGLNASGMMFSVEDADVVDLNAPTPLSIEDLLDLDTAMVAPSAQPVEAEIFDPTAEIVEMAFAADLLLLQDDGAAFDG